MNVTYLQLRFHNSDAKSDDLNVIPGTHIVEGKHQFLHVPWHMHTHTDMYTYTWGGGGRGRKGRGARRKKRREEKALRNIYDKNIYALYFPKIIHLFYSILPPLCISRKHSHFTYPTNERWNEWLAKITIAKWKPKRVVNVYIPISSSFSVYSESNQDERTYSSVLRSVLRFFIPNVLLGIWLSDQLVSKLTAALNSSFSFIPIYEPIRPLLKENKLDNPCDSKANVFTLVVSKSGNLPVSSGIFWRNYHSTYSICPHRPEWIPLPHESVFPSSQDVSLISYFPFCRSH